MPDHGYGLFGISLNRNMQIQHLSARRSNSIVNTVHGGSRTAHTHTCQHAITQKCLKRRTRKIFVCGPMQYWHGRQLLAIVSNWLSLSISLSLDLSAFAKSNQVSIFEAVAAAAFFPLLHLHISYLIAEALCAHNGNRS